MLIALPAFAANAPANGPAPDPLTATLTTVEDLLARFEETATAYHVSLVNDTAARREGALRLARMGLRAAQRGEPKLAARCLGWAAHFPGAWWYQSNLPVHQVGVLVDAMATCDEECASGGACTSGARRDEHASEWDSLVRRASRRPFIPPNITAASASGGMETVLEFVHYPRETFAVQVDLDGVAMASGEIRPEAQHLRVKPALGTYRVTAQLASGPVTNHYRATALTSGPDGFKLNGAPYRVKACRLDNVDTATREVARGVLERCIAQGFNLGVVQTPPLWLVELSDELSFGLAVEPSLSGPDGRCAMCCGETGVSGLQDRIAAHVRRYAEAPAVRMWVASPTLAQDAELVLESTYALYKELDDYARPVLYFGEADAACTARDAVAVTAGDADGLETAKRLELPALAVIAEGVEAEFQGSPGALVGSVDLAAKP